MAADDARSPEERLRELAVVLREAATRAGRPDVAAKADEAVRLLTAGREDGRRDTGNAILRLLDGLGF